MVNARLREKAKLAIFFANQRHLCPFFLNYETDTSKCFKCECKRSDASYKKQTNEVGLLDFLK